MKSITILLKVFTLLITFSFTATLTGCATAPTPQEQMDAYYGPEPESFESIIKDYMRLRLKDPSSAVYEFSGRPSKMWAGGGLAGKREFGWGICTSINAKNSFGGYTGAKKYFFIIRDDMVARMDDATYMAVCKSAF